MKNFALFAAFILTVAFSFSAVLAHDDGTEEHELIESLIDFDKIKEYEIPGFIGQTIGDARINIYDFELEPLGSIAVEQGVVIEGKAELLENPTHRILVKDADTAQKVFNADSFVKEFNRQRSLNNIKIEAFSFLDQFKLMLGTWVVAMISVFVVPE